MGYLLKRPHRMFQIRWGRQNEILYYIISPTNVSF
nr:MAG TPA: hypothetical protein [Caudoviricetes sp.]